MLVFFFFYSGDSLWLFSRSFMSFPDSCSLQILSDLCFISLNKVSMIVVYFAFHNYNNGSLGLCVSADVVCL